MEAGKTVKGRITKKTTKPNEDVYDLTVESNSNFFADDILVHNCGEILLRDREFCNLSEAIIRSTDTAKDIEQKIKWATILGTWQSTLTNFKYISKKWKENCEEERLLGVSLTGIMDSTLTNGQEKGLSSRLSSWRDFAIQINREYSSNIGVPESTAITCVKPSGTVSQLVDAASGIHARHSPYYIRTVRSDKNDPLSKMMVDMGFPVEDDITKPKNTNIFSFPIKSPETSMFRNSMSAIEQLELWKTYKEHWTEHNPSVTISVREDEWLKVGAWVYENFDNMTGVSFLPYSDHVYKQAPYQECSKEEYNSMLSKMPEDVDWSLLQHYEKADSTTGTQTLACTGAGSCDLI